MTRRETLVAIATSYAEQIRNVESQQEQATQSVLAMDAALEMMRTAKEVIDAAIALEPEQAELDFGPPPEPEPEPDDDDIVDEVYADNVVPFTAV